jgi:hypothetical protein
MGMFFLQMRETEQNRIVRQAADDIRQAAGAAEEGYEVYLLKFAAQLFDHLRQCKKKCGEIQVRDRDIAELIRRFREKAEIEPEVLYLSSLLLEELGKNIHHILRADYLREVFIREKEGDCLE